MFVIVPFSACDCDPKGSLNEGLCDSKQDPINELEAGKCHCKQYVTGRRCDVCLDGYFDLREDNPVGCRGMYTFALSVVCSLFPVQRYLLSQRAPVIFWERSVTPDVTRRLDNVPANVSSAVRTATAAPRVSTV